MYQVDVDSTDGKHANTSASMFTPGRIWNGGVERVTETDTKQCWHSTGIQW